jgi:hypothetical protein
MKVLSTSSPQNSESAALAFAETVFSHERVPTSKDGLAAVLNPFVCFESMVKRFSIGKCALSMDYRFSDSKAFKPTARGCRISPFHGMEFRPFLMHEVSCTAERVCSVL